MLVSVRLVDIDYYLAPPISTPPTVSNGAAQGGEDSMDALQTRIYPDIPIRRVPVLRVFGITAAGQKTCVHIHQVYPYIYVPYDGNLQSPQAVRDYAHQLALSINHALALAYNRPRDPHKVQYVMAVLPVKGIPFYGYHHDYQAFLKVYLLDPKVTTKLADLLISGAVMGRKLQAYEYHVPYILQFMMDFNLYGMSMVEFAYGAIRMPISERVRNEAWQKPDGFIDADKDYSSALPCSTASRQSTCELELDCWPWDILNRDQVQERPLEPFEPVFQRESALVHSLNELWEDEKRRLRRERDLDSQESLPSLAHASPANNRSLREESEAQKEFKRIIRERYDLDSGDKRNPIPIRREPFFDLLMSTFQSVTALFPAGKEVQNKIQTSQVSVDQVHAAGDDMHASFPVPSTPVSKETPLKLTPSRRGVVTSAMKESPYYSVSTSYRKMKAFVDEEIALSQRTETPTKAFPPNQEQALSLDELEDPMEADDADFADGEEVIEDDIDMLELLDNLLGSDETSSPDKEIHGRPSTTNPITPEKAGGQQAIVDDERTDLEESCPSSMPASQESLNYGLVRNNESYNYFRNDLASNSSTAKFSTSVAHLWSPLPRNGNHDLECPAFFFSPPRPFSPTLSAFPTSLEFPLSFDSPPIQSPAHTSCTTFEFHRPPTAKELLDTLHDHNLPDVMEQEPYFSKLQDIPKRMRLVSSKKVTGKAAQFLPEFASKKYEIHGSECFRFSQTYGLILEAGPRPPRTNWTLTAFPPSRKATLAFLDAERKSHHEKQFPAAKKGFHSRTQRKKKAVLKSQIEGPTPKNTYCFKYDQNSPEAMERDCEFLTIMNVEIHVNTRGKLYPDPTYDPVECVFFCIQESDPNCCIRQNGCLPGFYLGYIVVEPDPSAKRRLGLTGIDMEQVPNEEQLLSRLVDVVMSVDPDILTGYEIHSSSWGYLVERAAKAYRIDLCSYLSRIQKDVPKREQEEIEAEMVTLDREQDEWGFRKTSMINVTGRIVLNVWRLMRAELDLTSYTLENMAYHVLHVRIPKFSFQTLTKWYTANGNVHRWRTMRYYIDRTQKALELLEECNLIGRTSEFARVYGVEFYSIISRGSQYKVESMMIRIAKPENFVMISPSRQQVYEMRAMDSLPLVMEPRSNFYTSPVIVLDFQSLYPSIMIAYNYCYSTCLGKFIPRELDTLGFTDYKANSRVLQQFLDEITVSPNGVAFMKPNHRQGVLRKMLTELLETRVMVKDSMKRNKNNKTLYRKLDARQLGLKLLSNVTYGYTSAGFSGRMPCVEIADSIVQTGRTTLEKTIEVINGHSKWNARVVYGDTDSVFVELPGSSKARAFQIGKEIAEAITSMNPKPVKLKFEKVYYPCMLLTKKRYVGFKYETPEQVEPVFDAKGIETVRRDGCPVVAKMMENSLKYLLLRAPRCMDFDLVRILFRSRDMSELKEYLQRQWIRILNGRISIQDFIIAKAVRLGTYSERGLPPPGAYLAIKRMREDHRQEPQFGERIPYIIAYDGPNARLVDSARSPHDFAQDESLQLHATYYITKQIIPVLARVFDIIGVDLQAWYEEIPRFQKAIKYSGVPADGKSKTTIDRFYVSRHCLVCDGLTTNQEICAECMETSASSLFKLNTVVRDTERRAIDYERICDSCSGGHGLQFGQECISIDCPVFYERTKANRKLGWLGTVEQAMKSLDI